MKINNRGYRRINNYSEGWKDIHETARHGLTICYKEESVRILKDFYIFNCNRSLACTNENIW